MKIRGVIFSWGITSFGSKRFAYSVYRSSTPLKNFCRILYIWGEYRPDTSAGISCRVFLPSGRGSRQWTAISPPHRWGFRHKFIFHLTHTVFGGLSNNVIQIVKIQIQGRNTTIAGLCDSFYSDRGKSVLCIAVKAFFHHLDLLCPAGFFVSSSQ